MSNPNNALGTNAAFGGRTSVNAFNDVMNAFSGRGIISGWGCVPSSGLTVELGGNGTDRDVAIAEDSGGNKTSVNNISQAPISVTISAAPASNSRIDAIVAYIESSPSSNAITDNYDVVNLLTVTGTAASTPSAPDDNAIRTAITADGASGPTAYYVVLAYITIASGTTDIDAGMIASGGSATLIASNVPTITSSMVDFTSIIPQSTGVELNTNIKYNSKIVYAQRFTGSQAFTAYSTVNVTLSSSVDSVIEAIGWCKPGSSLAKSKVGTTFVGSTGSTISVSGGHYVLINSSNEMILRFNYGTSGTFSYDVVVYYTKTS